MSYYIEISGHAADEEDTDKAAALDAKVIEKLRKFVADLDGVTRANMQSSGGWVDLLQPPA